MTLINTLHAALLFDLIEEQLINQIFNLFHCAIYMIHNLLLKEVNSLFNLRTSLVLPLSQFLRLTRIPRLSF
jgi:hypothetical protein